MIVISKVLCRYSVIPRKSHDTFHRNRKIKSKNSNGSTKDPGKTKTSLAKEQSWKHYCTWFQALLHGYSNKTSMTLVPKQTCNEWVNRGLKHEHTVWLTLGASVVPQRMTSSMLGKGSLALVACQHCFLAPAFPYQLHFSPRTPTLYLELAISYFWVLRIKSQLSEWSSHLPMSATYKSHLD